jgi:cobalt-precorrin-5B (C1)-methyltransferase
MMGESVDLKARSVRVVISAPSRTAGVVRPFATSAWRERVERAVSALTARGETTLVLCTGGRGRTGARRMLPKLPDVCFVEAGDFAGTALRRAADRGVTQVVFVGMAGRLTDLAVPMARTGAGTALLAEITETMGGPDDLVARIAAAPTTRHAHELWEAEGLLGRCGRELGRRAAVVLEDLTGGAVAAQVVLVDVSGQKMIAMYGRLSR